jgi:hypothetical protein
MSEPRELWWLFDLAFYLAFLFVTSHTHIYELSLSENTTFSVRA